MHSTDALDSLEEKLNAIQHYKLGMSLLYEWREKNIISGNQLQNLLGHFSHVTAPIEDQIDEGKESEYETVMHALTEFYATLADIQKKSPPVWRKFDYEESYEDFSEYEVIVRFDDGVLGKASYLAPENSKGKGFVSSSLHGDKYRDYYEALPVRIKGPIL